MREREAQCGADGGQAMALKGENLRVKHQHTE